MCVGRKWEFALCQNCVTYPQKPWGNTVTYGHTSTHIDVAEIVESEMRWWVRAPRHRDHLFHAIVITQSTAS
jgi:hypothetical protein